MVNVILIEVKGFYKKPEIPAEFPDVLNVFNSKARNAAKDSDQVGYLNVLENLHRDSPG